MYPEEIVAPCRAELVNHGFASLETAEQVREAIEKTEGVHVVSVNSVCGCAARGARPGVIHSLQNEKRPSAMSTVFAGVDSEAVQTAREYFLPYPPSSPSIALFKNGELVHFVERHQIEGSNESMLAEHLKAVYNHFC